MKDKGRDVQVKVKSYSIEVKDKDGCPDGMVPHPKQPGLCLGGISSFFALHGSALHLGKRKLVFLHL